MAWCILGSRRVPESGKVEFLASDPRHMVPVATLAKVYVISPAAVIGPFMLVPRYINEMGSLSPLKAQSVYPTVVSRRVRQDRIARIRIPSESGCWRYPAGCCFDCGTHIRIYHMHRVTDSVPRISLLLLPVLEGLIWLFWFCVGAFYLSLRAYTEDRSQPDGGAAPPDRDLAAARQFAVDLLNGTVPRGM